MSDTTRDDLNFRVWHDIFGLSGDIKTEEHVHDIVKLINAEVLAVLERLESKSVEFNVDFINGTSEPAVEMKYIKQEKQNYAKQ